MAEELAGEYFHRHARQFDSIYDWRSAGFKGWLNRWLRKDMFVRFELTFAHCSPLEGRRVLDVGCGAGRYALEFAARGAAQVVGVDVAPAMVELARKRARAAGLDGRCRFLLGTIDDLGETDPFDCAVAIGLFDYIDEPLALLRRMRELSRRVVVATFPARWTLRAPIRKLRLWLKGCPVYFYSRSDIARLFSEAGFARHEILYSGQIHVVRAVPQ